MPTPRSCSSTLVQPLAEAWEAARTAPGAVASPEQLPHLDWLPAPVPGTFAAALKAAGRWDGDSPLPLDDEDIWYRTRFPGGGEETLHFDGLATIAEVWLNGEPLFRSDNMFLPRSIRVRTGAHNELHICFRSLTAWLATQRGRARWRPRLVSPPTLRFARTTLLGRMPGWCPSVHPVGPYRPIRREHRTGPFAVEALDVSTAVFDTEGRVVIHAVLDTPVQTDAVLAVGPHTARLEQTAPDTYAGELRIPDAALWWPHTHGAPHLHPATLRFGDVECELGPLGFRDVRMQPDTPDGFALTVNGARVFCRGACWTSPDIVALPGTEEVYRPWLEQARDAGMNMIRIGGTMLYESDAFFALCDELGLLVWQDAMLANFDYPATPAFREALAAELTHLFRRTLTNPSLAVFCGGSEVLQQATMFGVMPDRIDATLYTDFIPALAAEHRPDLIYVENSPSGGAWPFQPDTGVTHYYGVGAYLRPLDDARRAAVKFASECLAVANVPCTATTEKLGLATITDPRWKQAVPRDLGVGWDFEDVRDHYLALLFGVDPLRLRYAGFARYLDLSRAVSCILMEHVFAEWRRVGSSCAGGLVWQFQDLIPGAGWGVLDATGRRKPAWYALSHAFRPRQVLITDEGLNGLHIHVLNESDLPLDATLELVCLRDGVQPVRQAQQPVSVPPRGALRLESNRVIPRFFDITYAYRFGPPSHDVTLARLLDRENNCVIAETVHFPNAANGAYALPVRDIGVEVALERNGKDWMLHMRSRGFAQFLHIDDANFEPEDDWFHLAPGAERHIRLRPVSNAETAPTGEVSALNADRTVRYAVHA